MSQKSKNKLNARIYFDKKNYKEFLLNIFYSNLKKFSKFLRTKNIAKEVKNIFLWEKNNAFIRKK